MKKILLPLLIFSNFTLLSQVELKYEDNMQNLPIWVQLMYSQNADEGAIISAYNYYYKKSY